MSSNEEKKEGMNVDTSLAVGVDITKKKPKDEHHLEYNGYKCPQEYVNEFTPMEFEELVTQFEEYDVDGNGTLDGFEIQKILHEMEMDFSIDSAKEFLADVDEDGSGLLEFKEFASFIAKVKGGNPKYKGFSKLANTLNATPISLLEDQAKQRDFKVSFELVEEREETSMHPKFYVMECQLTGTWHELDKKGMPTVYKGMKRFQGIGQTTREAKFKSVNAALSKLRALMPGLKFKPGEIPKEWYDWVLENMKRGCDVHKLLKNLATKGFQASKHGLLMHRVMAWESFKRMSKRYPDLYPDADHMNPHASSNNPACLPEEWQQWIDECMRDGIDGFAVIETLRDDGVELKRGMLRNDDGTRLGDKLLLQALMRNEGGTIADPINPVLRNFFIASATGSINDVNLYISAGQQCDALEPGRTSSTSYTALALAAANGHCDVCEAIIADGHCDIDQRDNLGRTALHHAAKASQAQTLALILEKGGNMHLKCNYGNTPFHTAARSGSAACVEVLASHEEENLRQVLSGKVVVSNSGQELMGRPEANVFGVASVLYNKMISEKMKRSDAQRFLKDWCFEAAQRVYDSVKETELKMIGPPTKAIMNHTLEKFDPDPDAGYWVGKKGDMRWIKIVEEPKHLIQILMCCFKHCFVDATNGLKRTALHEACSENRCGSHTEAIKVMVDLHRSNTISKDMHLKTPYDLLIADKNRLGEPTGSALRESLITEKRTDLVESLRAEEIERENEETRKRLEALLNSCIKRGIELGNDAWGMMREISEHSRTYGEWMEMEDGDTKNFFWAKYVKTEEEMMQDMLKKSQAKPKDEEKKEIEDDKEEEGGEKSEELKRLEEDEEERKKVREKRLAMKAPVLQDEKDEAAAATWDRPEEFNLAAKVREGWSYILKNSGYERRHGIWDVMCDLLSGESFFKNGETEACQWNKPFEASWEGLMQASTVKEELGLHNEWEHRVDNDGNEFYVRDSNKLISALNATHRFINLYFTHREIEADSAANTKVVIRHKEKGPGKETPPGDEALNEMSEAGKKEWLKPKYRWSRPPEAVPKMITKEKMDKMRKKHKLKFLVNLKLQKQEADFDYDLAAKRDTDAPVQLAFVPHKWPDGKFKLRQGWALCRKNITKTSIKGWQVVVDPEVPRFVPVGSKVMAEKEGSFGMYRATVMRQVTPLYYDIQYDRNQEEEAKERSDYEKAKKSAKLAGRKKPPPPPAYQHETAECLWRGKVEPEGKEFWSHAETGACSWFPPREVAAVLKGERPTSAGEDEPKDADILFYPWPAQSASEWNDKRHTANSTLRRTMDEWEEYVDTETREVFYVNTDIVKKEDAVLLIQRHYKQRYSRPIPIRWESQAYTFIKPPKVAKMERERQGWAVLRRRSNIERKVTDVKGLEWEQYADAGVTGERYFFCEKTGDSRWDQPKLPDYKLAEKRKNAQAELKIGDRVYYRFPGLKTEKLCVITRVRQDDETLDFLYDFAVCTVENPLAPVKKMIPSTNRDEIAKFVPRQLVRMAPKSAEEVKIEIEMEAWTLQLRRSAARDERVDARQKEIAAEEARLKRRGGRKKAARKTLTAEEVAAARKRRMDAEKAIREEEERRKKEEQQNKAVLAAAAKAGASVAAVEAQKRGGGVHGKAAKEGAEDKEAAMRMQKAKIEAEKQFNERKNTLEARAARERKFEEFLSKKEDAVTTPRTMSRRRVLRIVHRAMLRQEENFVICEWGCGEWVKMGQQQHFHEHEKCRKRIIPCNLGCPLKNTEEEWMSLKEGSIITNLQHHEEVECPRRLVPCRRRCGEWVAFSDLDIHMKDLCVKRPFPELYCRLGCGETFTGGAHRMLQCEEERLEHENEMCPLRLCRCSWKGCVALVRAKDRDRHRQKHIKSTGISVYPQPGVYVYEVPEKVFQVKVQVWGAGGGSGHIKKYEGGDGGSGGFVEALLSVVPREKLELCVGSGGDKGVYGKQIEVTSWDGSEVNLEDRYGTATGGLPGGGEGHGGNQIWGCGGGGGYSIVQRRGGLGLEPLLVGSGGGGGGSRNGVPGGAEDGELPSTKIDIRNGRMGRSWCGGGGGDSGDVMGCKFPPQSGEPWKGGNGGEYGGGGGGGLFGGGGGGTSPGIVGGGGGGSSYVNKNCVADYLVIQGNGRIPGGHDRTIPPATGVGEWDLVGGTCGEGGRGDPLKLEDGKCGCIIIKRPGFYEEDL